MEEITKSIFGLRTRWAAVFFQKAGVPFQYNGLSARSVVLGALVKEYSIPEDSIKDGISEDGSYKIYILNLDGRQELSDFNNLLNHTFELADFVPGPGSGNGIMIGWILNLDANVGTRYCVNIKIRRQYQNITLWLEEDLNVFLPEAPFGIVYTIRNDFGIKD